MRTSASYDIRMEFQSEVCPACAPEKFAGVKVTDPSDRRIWAGHEVNPERYYDADSNGIKRARDEERQDTWDAINIDDEDEVWRIKKRQTRRTTPMTQNEIAAADHFARTKLRPMLEEARKQVTQ